MLWQSFNIRRIRGKSNQLVSPEEDERVKHHTHSMEYHSCQPLLGVNLSPESVNLYFPYAGWGLLFFRWWQQHFEFQLACVAVERRSNVVRNTHVQLQISLPTRFLCLLHWASQCAFGDGVCWLLVWQFFSLFAQFKTTKSHEHYVFLYSFTNITTSPQSNEETVFYAGKLYGLTGMNWTSESYMCIPKWFHSKRIKHDHQLYKKSDHLDISCCDRVADNTLKCFAK